VSDRSWETRPKRMRKRSSQVRGFPHLRKVHPQRIAPGAEQTSAT